MAVIFRFNINVKFNSLQFDAAEFQGTKGTKRTFQTEQATTNIQLML